MKLERWLWGSVSLIALALVPGCTGDPVIEPPPMPAVGEALALPEDPHREFDFWLGEWDVRNLHLRGGTWKDSGTAAARIQPVVDGGAVLEQWNGKLGGDPLIGFSLRAYDPQLGKWEIYLNWHGGDPGGFSEMHGRRNGERIELFPPGDDSALRYTFSQAHEGSCQWDRAVSDDGDTWTTNWVMQFTRRQASQPVDAANAPIVEPPASAASHVETRALDFLIGSWGGPARFTPPDGSPRDGMVWARVTSMIEGFGLLQFLDNSQGSKTMAAMGWDSGAEGWIAIRAATGSQGLVRMDGDIGGREVSFATTELRESWSCAQRSSCAWKRELSPDGGQTWQTVVEARLQPAGDLQPRVAFPQARSPLPHLLTGGQPSVDDLARMAGQGYRTVINLRAVGEDGEIPDEAEHVRQLGMEYLQIPIGSADDLNEANARRLAEALSRDGALPAVVHCKSGNRVGALLALKAHGMDGATAEEALAIGLRGGMTRLEPAIREHLGLPALEPR